ncbi:MAG TPA: DUF456 domain-containing protein [Acidimicrobiales bacterium]|nr:DUF456 domain-containing protein [Acidimicrobiales bacterium]
MSTTGEILTGLVMAIGLVGVLLPVLPGLLLIAATAVVWAVAEGTVTAWIVAAMMIAILGAGTYLKYRVPGRELAAQKVPARTWVLIGVGGVIGFFVVPVIGALAGVVAGAYLGERVRFGSHASAWASTKRVIVSIGKGVALEFAAGTVAIAVWVAAVLVS